MAIFGNSHNGDDPVSTVWQGAQLGWVLGSWLGMAFVVVLKVAIILLIALLWAIWDGCNNFVRHSADLWEKCST